MDAPASPNAGLEGGMDGRRHVLFGSKPAAGFACQRIASGSHCGSTAQLTETF
jgi:hypothetical protein